MKMTIEDVKKLKADWSRDPCWDIEDTEGFEEFHDELLEFRIAKEKELEASYRKRSLLRNTYASAYPTTMEDKSGSKLLDGGLTKLEHYAGLAMQSIIESCGDCRIEYCAEVVGVDAAAWDPKRHWPKFVSIMAVQQARAMLDALAGN